MEQKLKIAVFIDFDNIEIGVKSTLHREFDVAAVLDALKERGEIVTKFAYANWGRQESATRPLSEHAVQMVQRDPSPRGDKNGADINLALDALEMAFTHDHINAFAMRDNFYLFGKRSAARIKNVVHAQCPQVGPFSGTTCSGNNFGT